MPSQDDEVSPKPARRRRSRAPSERSATGDSLNAYIREISKFQPLSADEEKVLARRIQQGDAQALQRLVEANLRFVVSYSKRYRGLGLAFLDIIHEGTVGLIDAAKRFDPDRNVKFISYAVWWVRQSIFHALSEQSRVFRLPQKLSGQVSKVDNVRQRLKSELERDPTTEELARHTSFTEAQVQNLLLVAGGDLSLSTAVGEDGKLELGDVLQQENVPSIERQLIKASFEERVRELVGGLDRKEQDVIRMRFGLDDDEEKTLQEIGEILHLSRERVRQIESKAKEKLRRKVQGNDEQLMRT
jgi:RNA polymerase primary sigma factor